MSRIEITPIPNSPNARVLLDGNDVTNAIGSYRLAHRAGQLAELTIDVPVVDVSMVGEADVRVLIGSQTFTGTELRSVVESCRRYIGLHDIGNRLAKAWPL